MERSDALITSDMGGVGFVVVVVDSYQLSCDIHA